jgi:predicted ATP-binding protein involved in virulence
MKMKIASLELENFRGIENSKINFDGKSAIIYGINGTGKSTILSACNLLFFKIFNELTGSNLGNRRELMILDSDIKNDKEYTKIQIKIRLGRNNYEYYRSYNRGGLRKHAINDLLNLTGTIREKYIGEKQSTDEEDEFLEIDGEKQSINQPDNDNNIPIYATYGVNRYVTNDEIQKMVKDERLPGKLEAWRDIFNPTINFKLFFEWFRVRQEYEYSMKIDNDLFEDVQLSTVRKAILKILDNDFSDIRIKITDDDARMIAVKHNTELSIAQLSEGEKCILSMAGDLARKLAIANPARKNPLEGEGIVLIDEVDLHLHPEWQGKIMPLLLKTFPNIQFIVTTHSPKILSEITEDVNIFEICENAENKCIEITKRPPMNGWDINHILSDFMHTSYLNINTKELVDRMYDAIENGEINEAEELAIKLASITDELNVDVVRARTILHRRR